MNIVPLSPEEGGVREEAGERMEPEEFPRSYPYTWAMLLARIYESLPLVCPRCGSAMRIIAFIMNAADVKRILEYIGEASEPPPVSPSRAPPEEEFEFNQDPPWEEEFDFDQRTEWDDDSEV
jgi:hypothetical protein